MKKIVTGAALVVLIMGCSFHFTVIYLNYIRTLGLGITPGVGMLLKPTLTQSGKDILQAR